MKYVEGQEYLKIKTKDELVIAYQTEYMEWKRTGVLQDGTIRTLFEILSKDDEGVSIVYAEKMFNERLAELFYRENQFDFTMEEILQLMIDGYRVTHRYFTDNEYIYMEAQNIFDESGYDFGTVNEEFWIHKLNNEKFQNGWLIYSE